MLQEIAESAAAVERLFEREQRNFDELGRVFRTLKPAVVTVSARGSSDHAASYFKYLLEITAGIPVASIGPSVVSIYDARLRLAGGIHVTISQSGASPDILAVQDAAKRGGAVTVAMVNAEGSPLARSADIVLPLNAGPEKSVAATKSFIASCAAAARLTQAATGDAGLLEALARLPEALDSAAAMDWSPVVPILRGVSSLYLAGRGPGFAIALEAALKAKETANLHAEAFSLAELMHGPMRLIDRDFPVLAFVPEDAAFSNSIDALARLSALGASVVTFSSAPLPGRNIAAPTTGHGLVDPVVALIGFYRLIERIARERGFDPDRPANLKKITETV